MGNQVVVWGLFIAFVLAMLALDLGVLHRKPHKVTLKESLWWSVFWIALAFLFNVWVWFGRGRQAGLEFLTGYLIERALSMDNLFLFVVIFSYFQVPAEYQHKVLFWGVLGALVMRAIFIAAGIALIAKFHWVIYIFGAFLVVTGVKMWIQEEHEVHPERNPVLKAFRRVVPVTADYEGHKFFVLKNGKRMATPMFIVLLFVETTDLVFALDSIPAVLAVTRDPFIVFTSNVFAILGLRALYFALADLVKLFEYLHYGLAVILVFVGLKMIFEPFYEIPVGISLGVVGIVLLASIALSMLFGNRSRPESKEVEKT